MQTTIDLLACFHMLGSGQERRKLCVTEDLWRTCIVAPFGGGQSSPWGPIYCSGLYFRHLFLIYSQSLVMSTEQYTSISHGHYYFSIDLLKYTGCNRLKCTYHQEQKEQELNSTYSMVLTLYLHWPEWSLHPHPPPPFHTPLPLFHHCRQKRHPMGRHWVTVAMTTKNYDFT